MDISKSIKVLMYTTNMKKINWKEIVIGLVLAILSTLLLLYKIEDQFMWTDEVYSYEIGEIIADTGNAVLPTGREYPRSSFYHNVLALSMRVLGKTTFASRVINIPFILGTMLVIYLILKKKNKLLGLSGSILYLTTNFTIALSRETRMYAMTSFFLALTTLAIYEGFVDVKKGIEIKLGKLKYKFNIWWMLVALISFYLMYDTQPLTLMMGFGLILFFIFQFTLEKKREYLLLILALSVFAVLGLYYRYGTLNPVDLYFSLSPDWASRYPPSIPYYAFILTLNLPWCALSSVAILYMIGKKREKFNIFIFSIFFTMLFILSLLQAQAERYIVPTIPLLITLSVLSIYDFYKYLKESRAKLAKVFLPLVAVIILIPQTIYLVKEIKEVDTYTRYSLNINKKLEFNKARDYIKENKKNGDYLIADFHSAYTLYWMDFDVDYFLLPDDDIHWEWGDREAYFGIPLINYDTELVNFVKQANEESKSVYIVIREERLFDDISDLFEEVSGFTRPQIFISQ